MELVVLSLFSYALLADAAPAPVELPSAASFFVSSLPGLKTDPTKPLHIYAGEILSDPSIKPISDTHIAPHIFFFMLKARRLADKERVVFWFNGGPGCSSFDGLLLESGPLRTDGKGGLKIIDGGWDEYTTMVFVDQPPGTGLSYTSTDHFVHELDEAASHVVKFLRSFYDIFPEYKNVETYLAGESYAGQFIPYIAQAILSSNLPTPLKGLAMGNAWIDGRNQYPAYLDFAVKQGLVKENSAEFNKTKKVVDTCLKKLDETNGPLSPSIGTCEEIMNSILQPLNKEIGGKKFCMNVYDVRLSDSYPACGMNWPPELPDMYKYLRRDDVLRALHAKDKSEAWVECNSRVGKELRNKNSPSSISLLPTLLEKVDVLLFSGDQDFICNYVGTEAMIANMTWKGHKGLGEAKELPWLVSGKSVGSWVNARNLSYVKVFNASHMVPYDLPQVSHDMMLRFMGLDITQLASGSANVPSKVGNDSKPALKPTTLGVTATTTSTAPGRTTTSAEQNKAMWEAYYNAGSAALTLVLIALLVGLFVFCRQRQRRLKGTSLPTEDPEERIPLSQMTGTDGYRDDEVLTRKKRKGKEPEDPSQTVFEVGSDGEEEYRDSRL